MHFQSKSKTESSQLDSDQITPRSFHVNQARIIQVTCFLTFEKARRFPEPKPTPPVHSCNVVALLKINSSA